jgi:rhodanese-related sulfurtransferase
MKKLKFLLIGFVLVPALFLSSCDRGVDINPENPIATPAFTLMKDYMIANELDINNILSGPGGTVKFVTGAPAEADLAAFLAKYYILDIRSTDAFGSGHIKGAKNIAFKDILTEAASANKQILMVCYTGQTACYATSLLRLYGYDDAQALKWGMSGWNPDTAGPWNTNVGDPAVTSPNWTYSSPPSDNVYNDPTIQSISVDGGEILQQRVEEVVVNGFKTASNVEVLEFPGNYFVNNYFSETDYSGFGHVSNAYRIKEDLLLITDGYKALDSDASAQMVSYCYTGQTSAVLTAWLQVLGYDAYSLTFGMNGMYHSNSTWTTNQWGVGSSVPKNLPLIR